MKDVVERPLGFQLFAYVLAHKSEAIVSAKTSNVRSRSGRLVVDTEDIPSLIEKVLAQMRSEESSTARDQCSHRRPRRDSFRRPRTEGLSRSHFVPAQSKGRLLTA